MNIAQKYEHWMEVETVYALTKFADEDGRHRPEFQYPYWEAGIATGSFSFKTSALNYLQRAWGVAQMLEKGPQDSGLLLVQMLGKAAHNLVAMDATGRSYHANKDSQLANDFDTFYALSQVVAPDTPVDSGTLTAVIPHRREIFSQLQRLQDQGDLPAFHSVLAGELLFSANQFVSAAEQYGWPEPGHTSGELVMWLPESSV